jgi:hypothetical protein
MEEQMANTNGELKIEDGIPLPGRKGGTGYTATLRKLEVGQSVVLPVRGAHANALAKNAMGSGAFACRKVDDDHTRVWRTK